MTSLDIQVRPKRRFTLQNCAKGPVFQCYLGAGIRFEFLPRLFRPASFMCIHWSCALRHVCGQAIRPTAIFCYIFASLYILLAQGDYVRLSDVVKFHQLRNSKIGRHILIGVVFHSNVILKHAVTTKKLKIPAPMDIAFVFFLMRHKPTNIFLLSRMMTIGEIEKSFGLQTQKYLSLN